MTRALIAAPIWSRVSVNDEPVAPSSGLPSAYHCVSVFAGCGVQAEAVSDRVVPTSGLPWIVGSCEGVNVPGATGAVARVASPGV